MTDRHASSSEPASPGTPRRSIFLSLTALCGVLIWAYVLSTFPEESLAQVEPKAVEPKAVEPKADEPKASLKSGPVAGVELEKTSAAVRRLIRDFLNGSEASSQRAASRLRRQGLHIVPQLRFWLHRVKYEILRVEQLIERILIANSSQHVASLIDRDLPISNFFHLKLIKARNLARAGNYRKARAIADALLILDAESPISWELRRLSRETKERVLAEDLEPRVDAEHLIYEAGDKPKLTFRIINRTRNAATIELDRGFLATLRLEITRRDVTGGLTRRVVQSSLKTDAKTDKITLAPGEVWEEAVTIPALEQVIEIANMVGRVKISGSFRPRSWHFSDDREDNISLKITRSEIWFVPPAQKKGLESPINRLIAALFFGKSEAFLVGGQLSVWAGARDAILNEKLVEVLVENLADLSAAHHVLARAWLAEATGERFKSDDEWLAYWSRHLEARGESPPAPAPQIDPGAIGNHAPKK